MKTVFFKKIDRVFGSVLIFLISLVELKKKSSFRQDRFLFIRPGGIGDAVLLIPSILALKVFVPNCSIDVLAESRNREIFKLCPEINQTYRYDKIHEFYSCLKKEYDVVIDTEQWHRLSAVVARIIKAKIRIGFGTTERRRVFSYAVDYSHDRYEQDSFLDLLAPLEIRKRNVSKSFLSVPQQNIINSNVLLKSLAGKDFVVLFSGASIPERRWGVSQYRELSCRILKSGVAVVLVGGKEDVKDAYEISRSVDVLNLVGKTSLLDSTAIIKQSKMVVTGDSGILHIAVGLNKPTVSLFGPGIAKKWAPRGDGHIVLNKELECSPCTKFGTTPKCPRNASCLQQITVEEVFNAVERLIV